MQRSINPSVEGSPGLRGIPSAQFEPRDAREVGSLNCLPPAKGPSFDRDANIPSSLWQPQVLDQILQAEAI